ncbi:MAG: RdgB/HAM1 family non-canonical purine NTP pyrophosphatase [Candidatus Omnitrophica bacterium]|nr:RdgB/HAM1 family non-canonical purine NTP pyrophosphatase [Candidatus Omnitrophota bacterium]
MLSKLELLVATRNRKKFREIKQLLKPSRFRLSSLADFANLPKVKETGKSFKENAEKKARQISRLTSRLTLGEDSGLCVNALGGAPGIYSSRFAGLHKSDEDNNNKLLRKLDCLPLSERKAHYVCAIALAYKGKILASFEGRCHGLIGFKKRGSSGFGYDPVFIIPHRNKTFAQLGLKVKHTMSHRRKAIRKLKAFLRKAEDILKRF